MKYAHLVKLSVFSYEHENAGYILDAFLRFFPFNMEENKVVLKKTSAAGFNEKKIGIFEVTLTKDNLINQFLEKILDNLDKHQKQQIISQIESRLDNKLNFFLRFDKDAWLNEKKLILTDSGKCFHIKVSVAAFPEKREIALRVMRDLFSGNL